MADTALAEIKESEATGAIAEIYADLRNALGVPMVNLIFRNMATVPGCLEWVWAHLGPAYVSGSLRAAAEGLVAEVPDIALNLTPADLGACGLDAAARAGVAATCAAYGKANPANLIALEALRFVLEETVEARLRRKPQRGLAARPTPATLTALPPMVDLASAPAATREALRRLARQLHGGDGPVIPSFYRHFGAWPAFLDLLHARLTPPIASGQLQDRAQVLERDAHGPARMIYFDCPATRLAPPDTAVVDTLKELIDRFPANICKMTLVARGLGRALAA
ncbi:MAG: hypothetical protein SFV19_02350 [Rhodospirillaceae bacterium]|nr:hypothetical protein [Rhodospirillaceae bacterium]